MVKIQKFKLFIFKNNVLSFGDWILDITIIITQVYVFYFWSCRLVGCPGSNSGRDYYYYYTDKSFWTNKNEIYYHMEKNLLSSTWEQKQQSIAKKYKKYNQPMPKQG